MPLIDLFVICIIRIIRLFITQVVLLARAQERLPGKEAISHVDQQDENDVLHVAKCHAKVVVFYRLRPQGNFQAHNELSLEMRGKRYIKFLSFVRSKNPAEFYRDDITEENHYSGWLAGICYSFSRLLFLSLKDGQSLGLR